MKEVQNCVTIKTTQVANLKLYFSSELLNFATVVHSRDWLALHQTHFLIFLSTQLDYIYQSYLHLSMAMWLSSSPWNGSGSSTRHFQA